jgi:SAM-dependent methyltransferase
VTRALPGPGFDLALAGHPADLLRSDGTRLRLDVDRWHEPATATDGWLLDRCAGPVVDLGCGPGRLVAALVERGIPVLGVDVSAAAAGHCRRRGLPMLRRDLFSRLPGEGRWGQVLLADGNIGIGGDPRRLLRRAAALLRPGGAVLVECEPDPGAMWTGWARVSSAHGVGERIPWASVGSAALIRLAASLGLELGDRYGGTRSFVELVSPTRPSRWWTAG